MSLSLGAGSGAGSPIPEKEQAAHNNAIGKARRERRMRFNVMNADVAMALKTTMTSRAHDKSQVIVPDERRNDPIIAMSGFGARGCVFQAPASSDRSPHLVKWLPCHTERSDLP
jgi:hypothetical protein